MKNEFHSSGFIWILCLHTTPYPLSDDPGYSQPGFLCEIIGESPVPVLHVCGSQNVATGLSGDDFHETEDTMKRKLAKGKGSGQNWLVFEKGTSQLFLVKLGI